MISVAAQEYVKALDLKQLKGPLISLVFKEEKPDGSLKTVAVHSKMARGALVKYALESGATVNHETCWGSMPWAGRRRRNRPRWRDTGCSRGRPR